MLLTVVFITWSEDYGVAVNIHTSIIKISMYLWGSKYFGEMDGLDVSWSISIYMVVDLFHFMCSTGPSSCDSYETCRCSIPQEYWDEYGAQYMIESSQLTSLLRIANNDYTELVLFLVF